jgi:hypothetical protein
MNEKRRKNLLRLGVAVAALAVVAGYWLIPIRGEVTVSSQNGVWQEPWPRWRVNPATPQPGETVTIQVTDAQPWPNVLATVNGRPAPVQQWGDGRAGKYTWAFVFPAPAQDETVEIVFYTHCDTGCQERSRLTLGQERPEVTPDQPPQSTKLCTVGASPSRNWHGRSGWDVEMTYAQRGDERFWGVDDLAWRIRQATDKGLRVLVAVDYQQGQSLPPADDPAALEAYLEYLRRLARDERLSDVYGFILGSGFEEADSTVGGDGPPVTPEWYARIVNGYGQDPARTDNAVQIIRAENPGVRVLAGPTPLWGADQNSAHRPADVPNTMNALAAALDTGARAKLDAGFPLAAPDGFAIHALSRAAGLGGPGPRTNQVSFRVYGDWLETINAFETTRGLPVYITAANTFSADDGAPPAHNYPAGWLTAALNEVNQESQVHALCWFLDEDRSGDERWTDFSLTRQPGRLVDAAAEFNALLQGRGTP